LAECGQEQIQRLLKGVVAVLSGKEQELPHPPHQVRLMLRQGQLLFPQEVGITFQYDLQLLVSSTHIQTSD
jgi:hypothetical protein